jgi:hypothetical protein
MVRKLEAIIMIKNVVSFPSSSSFSIPKIHFYATDIYAKTTIAKSNRKQKR